ncbi:MAG TPA: peptidylprolyl isomerase [Actinomycetota bacterium]|nr:peptidylprolyl isomerase [Actinomycetota bacterium]
MSRRYDKAPEIGIDPDTTYRARMETTHGTVAVELFARQAPVSVNNFVFLAREGFYDGVTFHRVIEGFMIQGGDPEGTGMGGPGYAFQDEFREDLRFDRPGLLAMANAGPNTNGSQFFITVTTPEHLNGRHTIFGRVVEGYDVVERISRLPTDARDAPREPVRIERLTIEETGGA